MLNRNLFSSFSILFALLVSGMLSACSSMSTAPEKKNVEVSRNKPDKECVSMGKVEGRTQNVQGTANDALEDLQQEAANKGANYLVVEQYSSSGLSVTGHAYKCP
jgi:hypothetical protein